MFFLIEILFEKIKVRPSKLLRSYFFSFFPARRRSNPSSQNGKKFLERHTEKDFFKIVKIGVLILKVSEVPSSVFYILFAMWEDWVRKSEGKTATLKTGMEKNSKNSHFLIGRLISDKNNPLFGGFVSIFVVYTCGC